MSASFILKETGANLRRHSLAALASVTTTALCLILLGGFVLSALALSRITAGLLDDASIAVYFKSSVSRKDAQQIRDKVAALSGVQSVRFISKEEAWEEEKKKYNHLPDLESMENPLGDELRLSLSDPQKSRALANSIKKYEEIEKVSEGGVILDRLLIIDKTVKTVGMAICGVLLLAAMLFIGNAIRLGVFSRRREIRIMKLVGATDGFIRMPFLLEGMLHGLIGGSLACLVLSAGYRSAAEMITQSLPFLPLSVQGLPMETLCLSLLGIGLMIGFFGSYFSVRRHLIRNEH